MTTLTDALALLSQDLSHHDLVILGLGREGWSSFRTIRRLLPEQSIILIDDQPVTQLAAHWQPYTTQLNTIFMTTQQALLSTSWLTKRTLVIKTPGLPLLHPAVKFLQTQATTITSNTALLYQVLQAISQPITIIGVTGTKGKSTTTSFIHHVLQTAQLPSVIGGNIGVPPLELLNELATLLDRRPTDPVYVVLEQSCHQLDDLQQSPHIAVIQNIVPEHLDYYGTFERYQSAKSSIARYQHSQDIVIANPLHPTAWEVAELSPGKKISSSPDSWLVAGTLLDVNKLQVKGAHNLENLIPGMAIGQHLAIPIPTLQQALSSFRPLPHRLEEVAEVGGVRYINDSLATVPDATVAGLAAFADRRVVLIAGGYDRGQDFGLLAEWICAHPTQVIGVLLFSPTGERLAKTITDHWQQASSEVVPLPTLEHVEHMQEAVSRAHQLAKPGDVVLLSPASASFGAFTDYADRGNQFKTAVSALV